MEGQTKKNRQKVSFVHSITAEILLLIIFVVVLAIVGFLTNSIPKSKATVREVNQNYIMSMAVLSVEMLDDTLGMELGTAEQYAEMLGDVKMEGIDSSYAYLVDKEGMMLYHPTAEKIGSPVENEVVTGLVAELKAGRVPQDDVVSYLFKGQVKYAAYAITEQNQILVVTADEAEIMEPVNAMARQVILVCMSSLVICVLVGFFISRLISNPVKQLTEVINETAVLDFRHNAHSDKLCKRKDETGMMARAVRDMRGNLRALVNKMEEISEKITDTVSGLQDITSTVDTMCTDNSATSQELAAGMEETAATTETINGNIGQIKIGAEEIGELTADGARTSDEIMQRAENLRVTTVNASAKTKDMYENVKVKAEDAIESSKAVHKINELTDTIMSISDQTSLLALNASIEAARAGEAGRGFAVVATEIGNLAGETSHAISDINNIVNEVNAAVAKMSDCLSETTGFLENTVLVDYKEFEKVSEQYSKDADLVKNNMQGVESAMANLSASIESIAEALSGINSTIGESTSGVTDIAEKTSSMVEKTGTSFGMVSKCNECSEELRRMVSRFILN